MGIFYLEAIIRAPVLSGGAYKIYFPCISNSNQWGVARLGNEADGSLGIS